MWPSNGARGCRIFDTEGRGYLDFAAGVAVNAFGHAHPRLVAVLKAQAETLWHCSNLYRVPGQERVAAKLVEATFADTAFFTNSGAEAMECAVKMVRKYHDETGTPERYRILCCTNAFHGRTLTTIAAGGQEKLTKGFGPNVDGFDHVPFGNLNELRAAITDETAAILVEPVQGEGGIHAAGDDYLRGLRQTADEYGLLLVFDEIQCGVGRTGKLFAHEWADVTPDIMAVAKGIGGGFPVGACLATEAAAVGMTAGTHGSTYGGNPLAMSVVEAVLDLVLEDGFLDRVDAVSDRLESGLFDLARRFPGLIEEVRGKGLMRGLKLAETVPAGDLIAAAREAGLLLVPAGENVTRLLPPLIVSADEIDEALTILASVCGAVTMQTEET